MFQKVRKKYRSKKKCQKNSRISVGNFWKTEKISGIQKKIMCRKKKYKWWEMLQYVGKKSRTKKNCQKKILEQMKFLNGKKNLVSRRQSWVSGKKSVYCGSVSIFFFFLMAGNVSKSPEKWRSKKKCQKF